MELLKELIIVVQLFIPLAATIKIIKLLGEHSTEEDKGVRNRKIINIIIIVIACETVIYLGNTIQEYYTET